MSHTYYVPVSGKVIETGHFCRVIAPHIQPVPQILDVERSNPEEHEKVHFSIRNANKSSDFRVSERILPLQYLRLRSNEELLIQKSKRRPAIVMSCEADVDVEVDRILRQQGKRHLQEKFFYVIPCYSTQKEGFGPGFPPVMMQRINCLLYRQFFPCPSHSPIREAVARLDRLQVVVGNDPNAISSMGIRLADEPFATLRAMLIYCLTGESNPHLDAIKNLLQSVYHSS